MGRKSQRGSSREQCAYDERGRATVELNSAQGESSSTRAPLHIFVDHPKTSGSVSLTAVCDHSQPLCLLRDKNIVQAIGNKKTAELEKLKVCWYVQEDNTY